MPGFGARDETHGLRLIDKFGAGGDLPAVISQGGMPAFVADQNAGDRGIFVPFFGRLASSYKSIGLMALTTNSSLVCGMARRLGLGTIGLGAGWGALAAAAGSRAAKRGMNRRCATG